MLSHNFVLLIFMLSVDNLQRLVTTIWSYLSKHLGYHRWHNCFHSNMDRLSPSEDHAGGGKGHLTGSYGAPTGYAEGYL